MINKSVEHKYTLARRDFLELIKKYEISKDEDLKTFAPKIANTGVSPKESLLAKLAIKDKIYDETFELGEMVKKEIANKNVKNVSKLIVKSSKKLEEKELASEQGLVS